jgi:hypothetical protein
VIAAAVVARRSRVRGSVPSLAQLLHRLGASRLEPLDEVSVDDEVGDALGIESTSVEVDVNACGGIRPSARGADCPDDVLEHLDVVVAQDGRDDLAAVAAAAQRAVVYDPPRAPSRVGNAPVATFVSDGAAYGCLDRMSQLVAAHTHRLDRIRPTVTIYARTRRCRRPRHDGPWAARWTAAVDRYTVGHAANGGGAGASGEPGAVMGLRRSGSLSGGGAACRAGQAVADDPVVSAR